MSHTQKACDTVKHLIEKKVFNDIDGYYLDPNSAVYKRVFKNWDIQLHQLQQADEWQRTGTYMKEYHDALQKYTKESEEKKYKNL
jgi:hypothetical protein